jgi:transketolase
MRAAFVKVLMEIAEADSRILLLTGDLGYMALEPFSQRFHERFFNVGVAEQNMVGLATGLAEAGFVPFVYSIATFATLRPYEFIRNGPVLHNLPVRIVGVGGGFEYGVNGITHYALEDLGVMRLQPNLKVIAPADPEQARTALLNTWSLNGPIYYRLGKDDKVSVPNLNGRFALDRVEVIREGTDAALITVGPVAVEATDAAALLAAKGVNCTVAVVATLNPAPVESLAELMACFPAVFTVEAHFIVGGLGSLVSEVVAEGRLGCRVVRCGVRTAPNGVSGSQSWLHEANGISSRALAATVWRELNPARCK